jgi:hypothetical protein
MKAWIPGETVGDFRNGYIDFGWDSFSPEEKTRQYNAEINQGRAAMMGILGKNSLCVFCLLFICAWI